MKIIDFVNQFNYTMNGATETLSQAELDELHVLVSSMMLDNCGTISSFTLTDKGQIELENSNDKT
jgi:hypothetical protein